MAVLLGVLTLTFFLMICAQTTQGPKRNVQPSFFMNENSTKGATDHKSILDSSSTLDGGTTESGGVFMDRTGTSQNAGTTSRDEQGIDGSPGHTVHKISRINIGACSHPIDDYIILSTTYNLTRELWIDPGQIDPGQIEQPFVECASTSYIPDGHYLNLTVDQLTGIVDGNFTLTVNEVENENWVPSPVTIDNVMLRNTSVSLIFTNPISFRFQSHAPHTQFLVKMHYLIQKGPYLRNLPSYTISSTVSYITSPGFNENKNYPNNYDGEFLLNITDDELILLRFSHHSLDWYDSCVYDYIMLITLYDNEEKIMCKEKNLFEFRSSLRVYFHTNEEYTHHGFRMIFTVVPRSEIQHSLTSHPYNCSAPRFNLILPLVRCNMFKECEDGEDEQDCPYHSEECGGFYDAGTKCYRFVRRREFLSWTDANVDCIRHGQNLVTFQTLEEYYRFGQFLRTAIGIYRTFVGLRTVRRTHAVSVATLYKYVWQWANGFTAFLFQTYGYQHPPQCGVFDDVEGGLRAIPCTEKQSSTYVCEFEKQGSRTQLDTRSVVERLLIDSESVLWKMREVHCPSGHVTRDFLSCDPKADCNAPDSSMSCQTRIGKMPMFMCQKERAALHYTLVCDHMQHCLDNSDEDFCWHPPCSTGFGHIKCPSGQCIRDDQQCDGRLDCYDGSDELCYEPRSMISTLTFPPGSLYFDGTGTFTVEPVNSSNCPSTHFLCPHYYCLPVYLRCNGIKDCPSREDEAGCDSYTCPGFYRCRGSKVCLHADNVCDGVPQCPEQDDELLCDLSCPDQCHCQGLAFVCSTSFSASSYPALRYLDASGSGMTPGDFTDNMYLIYLRLSNCGITSVPENMTFPNLWEFHLSWNKLAYLDMHPLSTLSSLRVLVLSGNPLTKIIDSALSELRIVKLSKIDLSNTDLRVLNASLLTSTPGLRLLNISQSKMTTITDAGFEFTPKLEVFDSRGSPIQYFPKSLLRNLSFLKFVHGGNYRLCCEAMLPSNFNLRDCQSVQDLFASCEHLFRSNTYRVFLWIFALLSIFGNMGSFAARLYIKTELKTQGSISVFITNLSIANFLMGLYLSIICVADLVVYGEYLWHEDKWQNSISCTIAGFLSLLSCEVSSFTICLITLDRFLVLRFPSSSIHFKHTPAVISCAMFWLVGIVLAAFPLLPMTSHWEFYSQTSICVPLPFPGNDDFHGYDYYFSVVILLNLTLCIPIAVGQGVIYCSMRTSTMSSTSNNQSNDLAVARCLTTIVMLNLLCWFSVGLLGVLASNGAPIPGNVGVAAAIIVLPFSSALNPFLYLVNVFMEKRKQAQEALLLERLRGRRQPDKNKDKAQSTTRL